MEVRWGYGQGAQRSFGIAEGLQSAEIVAAAVVVVGRQFVDTVADCVASSSSSAWLGSAAG